MCSDLTISASMPMSQYRIRLMKKSLPALHLRSAGTKLVPKVMASKQKTVGIRVPAHPICRLLIKTSATHRQHQRQLDDEEAPSEPFQIEQYFGNRIDLIIDGGPIFPDPSSVIDLTSDTPRYCASAKAMLLRIADQSLLQRFAHGEMQVFRSGISMTLPFWIFGGTGFLLRTEKLPNPNSMRLSSTRLGHRLQHDVHRQANILFLHGKLTTHLVY